MTSNSKGFYFDTISILFYLYKNKMPIIIITLIGAVSSIIISLLITPMYKSSVVIFPANQASISKSILTDVSKTTKNILKIGKEEDSERLLQILDSDEIKSKIIRKYNLYEHYDIEEDSKNAKSNMYNKYQKNIEFKKTRFNAIKIQVIDKDPKTSADIANDITALLDTTYIKIKKQRAIKIYKIVEKEYLYILKNISVYEDSLNKLRSMGVFNYNLQADLYNKAIVKAIKNNNIKEINYFDNKLKILAKIGGAYNSVNSFLKIEFDKLSNISHKYTEAKIDFENTIPTKYVINRAYKSNQKVKPVRWLIVLLSTISSMILSIVLIIINDNYKELWQRTTSLKTKS